MAHIIGGVDVSAAMLDARIGRDGVWQQFARTTDGIAQLRAEVLYTTRHCGKHDRQAIAETALLGE